MRGTSRPFSGTLLPLETNLLLGGDGLKWESRAQPRDGALNEGVAPEAVWFEPILL